MQSVTLEEFFNFSSRDEHIVRTWTISRDRSVDEFMIPGLRLMTSVPK